jgi:ABC-type multidrug transport system permease subunit
MICGNLFRLQLAAAFADRRRLLLRIGVSALLALPFIFVGMPARAQAAGIVMVILFTGFFGAAVGHARLREEGRLERILLLPTSGPTLWLDLALASTVSRAAPAVVVLATFVAVNARNVTVGAVVALAGLLCATLVLLTLLGMATARLTRNNAEVHLFGALTVGLLTVVSGVAPLPERLAPLAAATMWNPISRLLAALVRLSSGSADVRAAEVALTALALAGIIAAATIRLAQGAADKREGFDRPGAEMDNAARMKEGQG